ncbi:excise [Mycobacterium phage Baehexic]|nr:excise [Mycobacterium phage Baehexic]
MPQRASIQQTAEYLGVHPNTVRNYIAEGKLKAVRLGPRLIRIERDSIEALLRPIGK